MPLDLARTEEIKQAIRDESERRRDQQPRKRCIEEERNPSAATSAGELQDGDEVGGKEEVEGIVADEDQDSEPSDDEDDN